MAVLKGTFVFTNLQNPIETYEKDGFEYIVQLVVSEKTAKAWKKKFKKQAPREVETAEFESIYKIAPPFPDQDEQYVIKLRQLSEYLDKKTGKKLPITERMRVRALLNTGKTNSSGKPILEDVTDTTLIGNGSTGLIQFRELTNKYGTFGKPQAIRIDELVEYGSDNFDELGEVSDTGNDADFGEDDGTDDIPWDQGENSASDDDDDDEDLY